MAKTLKEALLTCKHVRADRVNFVEPKVLSKTGEWLRDHPDGIYKIVNMRAIMK